MPALPVLNFMRWRRAFVALSVALLILSIYALAARGLAFGLDLSGGTQVELAYTEKVSADALKRQLVEAGVEGAVLTYYGSEQSLLLRLPGMVEDDLREQLPRLLSWQNREPRMERMEFIGPQVGEELRDDGGIGLLVALLLVMVYIAQRFQYKFAVAAVISLLHDVVIVLGCFALFRLEFDLTVLAALLAVIGYSLNDTIVVFDRVRENFRLLRAESPAHVINISWTQTLGRTINTSLTTLLVLVVLFWFGGSMIHNFATALIIGVVIGTYSSVYVAASILLMMNLQRQDLLPARSEEDQEQLP